MLPTPGSTDQSNYGNVLYFDAADDLFTFMLNASSSHSFIKCTLRIEQRQKETTLKETCVWQRAAVCHTNPCPSQRSELGRVRVNDAISINHPKS